MITHRFVETTPVFHMDQPDMHCCRCRRENWDCECNSWAGLWAGYAEWADTIGKHEERTRD